ncbi:helix-turn-helix domain-containing protein, partial [Metapseudomonas otitidis]
CRFDQAEGERNNSGHYRIHDWGPIDPAWIDANLSPIKAVLGYP